MGGFGSGRYRWSSRDTVEDWRYRSFGIKDWVDRGLVQPGHAFTQIWLSKDRRPAASIDVHISTVSPVNRHLAVLLSDRSAVPDRLQAVLKYRAGRGREELRDIEEAVWLDTRPCGFKGQRLQLICPGCGCRIAELYPDGVHFRCRKCCGLGYRSQRKGREARGLEKAARIKQQLGGSGAYADPVPERPKGMHHRTYERLCNEAEKAELPYQWRVMTRLQGLLEKSGLLPSIESDHPDQEQVMKAVQRAPERPELLKQTRRARRRGRTKNGRSLGRPRRRG
jgi:hypothetical protein